jgi:uncharacterized protein YcaQ
MSRSQARRTALAAQGFARPVPARADRRHVRRVFDDLGVVQLDSVPVIARSQNLVSFSRIGVHDMAAFNRVAWHDGDHFECWAHQASVVPVSLEPSFRWRLEEAREGRRRKGLFRLAQENAGYVADVLAQVSEQGPLAASDLHDPRPRSGEWWGSRSDGANALDWLFCSGAVGIRRTPGFEKRFDLYERVVGAEVAAAPTPSEPDAHRDLIRWAAQALGVATVADLADYFRMLMRDCRPRIAELVESGELEPVEVEGWDATAYRWHEARCPKLASRSTVLSPFDPVVWFRPRAERLFDFDYRIEIYVPKEKRKFGYYVLPFLLGEELVGRVDLKTDRGAGVLRVPGAFLEGQVEQAGRRAEVAEALAGSLVSLSEFVGCGGEVVVEASTSRPMRTALRAALGRL